MMQQTNRCHRIDPKLTNSSRRWQLDASQRKDSSNKTVYYYYIEIERNESSMLTHFITFNDYVITLLKGRPDVLYLRRRNKNLGVLRLFRIVFAC